MMRSLFLCGTFVAFAAFAAFCYCLCPFATVAFATNPKPTAAPTPASTPQKSRNGANSPAQHRGSGRQSSGNNRHGDVRSDTNTGGKVTETNQNPVGNYPLVISMTTKLRDQVRASKVTKITITYKGKVIVVIDQQNLDLLVTKADTPLTINEFTPQAGSALYQSMKEGASPVKVEFEPPDERKTFGIEAGCNRGMNAYLITLEAVAPRSEPERKWDQAITFIDNLNLGYGYKTVSLGLTIPYLEGGKIWPMAACKSFVDKKVVFQPKDFQDALKTYDGVLQHGQKQRLILLFTAVDGTGQQHEWVLPFPNQDDTSGKPSSGVHSLKAILANYYLRIPTDKSAKWFQIGANSRFRPPLSLDTTDAASKQPRVSAATLLEALSQAAFTPHQEFDLQLFDVVNSKPVQIQTVRVNSFEDALLRYGIQLESPDGQSVSLPPPILKPVESENSALPAKPVTENSANSTSRTNAGNTSAQVAGCYVLLDEYPRWNQSAKAEIFEQVLSTFNAERSRYTVFGAGLVGSIQGQSVFKVAKIPPDKPINQISINALPLMNFRSNLGSSSTPLDWIFAILLNQEHSKADGNFSEDGRKSFFLKIHDPDYAGVNWRVALVVPPLKGSVTGEKIQFESGEEVPIKKLAESLRLLEKERNIKLCMFEYYLKDEPEPQNHNEMLNALKAVGIVPRLVKEGSVRDNAANFERKLQDYLREPAPSSASTAK